MVKTFLTLSIHSPFSTQSFEVEWVSCSTPTGSFVVAPHHAPMISLIKQGESVVYKKGEQETTLTIPETGAFALIKGNTIDIVIQ